MSVYEAIYKIMVSIPDGSGEILPEVRNAICGTPNHNRQVVLAYPPKVGGTFMRTALVNLLDENYGAYLSRGSYANSDQSRDLYLPTVLNQFIVHGPRPQAAVMHLHMFPSRHVTDLIEVFDMPVVIATRDILDCLISGIDMAEDIHRSANAFDDAIISNGKPYAEMSEAERRHAIVHTVPLWYARFYAQWLRYDRECREQRKRPPLWLTYDELKEDPQMVLARVARHVDPKHHYAADQVSKALALSLIDKSAVRYNRGISGRGRAYFTREEQMTIFNILSKAGAADMLRLKVLPAEAADLVADMRDCVAV